MTEKDPVIQSGENQMVTSKAPYEKPVYWELKANDAEVGIDIGPEILILLS